MPTLLRANGYRFFMYAADRDEPPHVHVEKEAKQAKFWLSPNKLAKNEGFNQRELKEIKKIIDKHHDQLIGGWYDFFYPSEN